MKKSVCAGMIIVTMSMAANETPESVLKSKSAKEVSRSKQVDAKVQEKAVVKQEVKIKSQNYLRGNIATH